MKLMVTGANGFVGGALLPLLRARSYHVRAAVRESVACDADEIVQVGDLAREVDWRAAVIGVDCVIHLAARVHVMRDASTDPLVEFRRENVDASVALAWQAAAAGVRRFVFVSSVKVNGEATVDRAFDETDLPSPRDPYGQSKAEAESALRLVGRETGLEVVVLRPPLVYGPGVKANFLRLLRWAARGVPLPLGAIHNRRSMVYVGNLADAITCCVSHPAAGGNTFLVADGEDLSTAELYRRLAEALGRRVYLVPVPASFLLAAGEFLGRRADVERMVGSLQVNSAALRTLLGWQPTHTIDAGLRQTARWFSQHGGH